MSLVGKKHNMNDPKFLIIHHTGGSDADPLMDSSNATFEETNELHKNKESINLGHPSELGYYIGYHYFIDKSGKITQGRRDTEEGAHTFGKNNSSIGICLAGNFDLTLPTKEQIGSLKILLRLEMKLHNIPVFNIYPHRKFAIKTCYGMRLSDTWAQTIAQLSLLEFMVTLLIKLRDAIKGRDDNERTLT
jgi:N-acetyl-anhydromuramyl-L-alanine amidase AmpD